MTQFVLVELSDLAFVLTESGYDDNPGWELRAYDNDGVEVYWTSHSSRDVAIDELLRKVKEALAPKA